uniref:Uncharacterized protein n=1 Tax=Chelydra serpentina TaxID=8475 RepID=A0A8C3XQS9_CHESE
MAGSSLGTPRCPAGTRLSGYPPSPSDCPSLPPSLPCPSVRVLTLSFCPLCPRCLQNYIPPQSLTLSCPVCRQTSILPEQGVAALQSNFFITNLMEVLQRPPEGSSRPDAAALDPVSAVTGQPLSCPNHEGKVGVGAPGWGEGRGDPAS